MRKPQKPATGGRSVKLPPELQEALNEIAEKVDVPASTLIRMSVRALVEAYQNTDALTLPLRFRAETLDDRLERLESIERRIDQKLNELDAIEDSKEAV